MNWIIILSTPIILIISKNWIIIWALFEINTFSFLAMLDNNNESEEIINYFLIQSIASLLILLSLNTNIFIESISLHIELIPAVIIISIALNSGAAPFYFWMPPIVRNISWNNTFLLLSIQNLAPAFFLAANITNLLINILIILSIIIGTLLQLTSINLKLLITYSSISHLSWILLSGETYLSTFYIYFLVYAFILIIIANEINHQNNSFLLKENSNNPLSLNILSFSGVPPLMGFIPNWIIILNIIESIFSNSTIFIIIIISCINIFIYIRIFFFNSLNNQKTNNKFPNNNTFTISIILNFTSPLLLLLPPL